MTRRNFLATLGAAPLLAAEAWEQRSFPNWTPALVDRLLTDSPWAKPLTVQFEYQAPPQRLHSSFSDTRIPGGIGLPSGIPGIGWPGGRGPGREPQTTQDRGGYPSVRTEAYLTLRWSSALPIRQAIALERWGSQGLNDPKAVEFLTREEPEIVMEIFGLPVITLPQGARRLEDDLMKTSRLVVKGRPAIRPTAARVPEHGQHLSAELRFPRAAAITADDGTLEFTGEAGPLSIAKKFKLKAMTYHGRLEL